MSLIFQTLTLLCLLLFNCCKHVPARKLILPGKYGSDFPGYIAAKKLEIKHKKNFYKVTISLLFLREDGSFVLGFCENQISLAGNYLFERDSLTLYNIYNFKLNRSVSNQRLFVDLDNESIFLVSPNKYSTKNNKRNRMYKDRVSILKRNKFELHTGILRNENWSLDSIYRFNEYWEHGKQIKFMDSVLLNRKK